MPTSPESAWLDTVNSLAITSNKDAYCLKKHVEKSYVDNNGKQGWQSYAELACDDENISLIFKAIMET